MHFSEYHKIQSIFKRDPETKYKTFLYGEWTRPEFEYLKDNPWILTEKIDGTNVRVGILPATTSDGERSIVFGGRTDRAQILLDLVAYLQKTFLPIQDKLFEQFPDGAVLYGEGYGAGIQKGGGNYSDTKKFVLFDVFTKGFWLSRGEVCDIAGSIGIERAPVLGVFNLDEALVFTREGFESDWGPFHAEGIVARPKVELKNRFGKRIITKIKHVDFIHETEELLWNKRNG